MEKESSQEQLQNELITPQILNEIKRGLDYQEQAVEHSVKRHLLGETAFVEVLRDSRNGRIIDIETGYPYFRRREHYGL